MATITETILADVQVKGLDKFGQLKVSMDTVAKSSEKAAKGIETIKVQASRAGKALGVNTKIARRFVNTALNAGFAAEDQAKAMAKIKEVAEKTGKPVEVIEKAWEGLARTLQNAEEATENLEDALRFQARAGIPEAEKAAARYAQTIGGGTDALKGLVGVGEVYAKQLDQIKDADLKARLTTKLARMELNRKRESIERVKDAYLSMSLRMKAALGPSNLAALRVMTKGIKLLAIAAGAALVGAFALAVQSIKKFIETDSVMKAAMDRTKEAVNDLQVALGSALVGGSKNAGKALDTLTGKAKILTKFINDNSDAIFEFSKSVASAFGTALKWSAKLVLGFKFLGAAIGDAMTLAAATAKIAFANLGRAALSAFNEYTRGVQQVLDGMIMLADKLGPNLVPDALRSVNLHGFIQDLSGLNEMAADANATLRKGFVSSEAVLGDIHLLDLLANKLEALSMTGTDAVVDPTKRKGKGGKGGAGAGGGIGEGFAVPGAGQAASSIFGQVGGMLEGATSKGGGFMADAFNFAQDGLGQLRDSATETADVYSQFFNDMDQGAIDMGVSLMTNFAGSAATAFGAAAASTGNFGKAMADLLKNTLASAAQQFGQFFVLKGTAIALDPLLGGPAVGLPIVAQGLALQAFGGAIGAMGGGGGGRGAPAAPAAVTAAAFQPREQKKEEAKETTLVINIAGETIGPAIWRAMDEGVRLGHVAQFA
jgi:hypothetical protein